MTDEEFFAWLDGELQGEAAERVAARVAASPELTKLAAEHRGLYGRLSATFDPVLAQSVPAPHFREAEVVDLGARAAGRQARRAWFAVPQWAAMAATLAIGIVAGQFVGDRSTAPVENRDGMLIAAAALDQALDARLASTSGDSAPRIGLTFRDRDGDICRSFTVEGSSGLACREGEQWKIEGLFAAPESQTGAYRMAAGDDPRLATLIDEMIADEPFDAAQEKAALEKGWR